MTRLNIKYISIIGSIAYTLQWRKQKRNNKKAVDISHLFCHEKRLLNSFYNICMGQCLKAVAKRDAFSSCIPLKTPCFSNDFP